MKKGILIWLVLILGLSYPSLAKAGLAKDENEFVLVIVGFLIVIAGFFEGIDYMKKNGKDLFKRLQTFLRNKMLNIRNSH